MDFIRAVFLLVLITLLVDGATRPQKVLKRSKRNHVNCRPNSLVRYKMTVETFWSKQTFPKMYPTYRPHAQWSVLVGRTHGSEYKMWEEGANATLGAKLFAELGDVSQLDVESVQGYDDILDSFVAPPVNKGVGQTSAIVMLDGHSSRLSFMMRIIPSPDWFIGVNSLDLCAHGRWKNKVHVDLTPYDAGTDQGLTFTAPNWPNTPQIPISAITSSFPDHPASSFLYPEFKKLPRLAYLELDIVSEYRHRETFMKVLHHYNASRTEKSEERKAAGDELATTTVKTESKLSPFSSIFNKVAETAYKNSNENHPATEDISAMFSVLSRSNTSLIKNKEENVLKINNTIQNNGDEMYVHGNQKELQKSTTRKVDTVNDTARNAELKPVFDSHFDSSSQSRSYFTTKTSEAGNDDDLPGSFSNSAADSSKDASKLEHVFKLDDLLGRPRKLHWKQDSTESTSEVNSILPVAPDDHRFDGSSIPKPADVDASSGTTSVDCEVSEWSEWSECSQSCGFGQLERTRNVSTYPQNGGSNCPLLRETNLCGSMRNCQWTPFTFLSPNTTKRQLREGRNRRPRVLTSRTLGKLH